MLTFQMMINSVETNLNLLVSDKKTFFKNLNCYKLFDFLIMKSLEKVQSK